MSGLRRGGEIVGCKNRQRIDVDAPLGKVATNPAKTARVDDHDPVAVFASVQRDERVTGDKLADRHKTIARPTAHVNVSTDHAAARRRLRGIVCGFLCDGGTTGEKQCACDHKPCEHTK